MTERRLSLEEAMKDAPKMTSRPQIRAAGKNTAEVRRRYGDAIEAAIGKASFSRERETVEAPDGAKAYAHPHARGIAWGVNADGGFNLLHSVGRPNGADEMGS